MLFPQPNHNHNKQTSIERKSRARGWHHFSCSSPNHNHSQTQTQTKPKSPTPSKESEDGAAIVSHAYPVHSRTHFPSTHLFFGFSFSLSPLFLVFQFSLPSAPIHPCAPSSVKYLVSNIECRMPCVKCWMPAECCCCRWHQHQHQHRCSVFDFGVAVAVPVKRTHSTEQGKQAGSKRRVNTATRNTTL